MPLPDYTFYRENYLGEDIPETAFPRLMKRAADQLARWKGQIGRASCRERV